MAKMLLVNPRKRSGRRKTTRRRSPARVTTRRRVASRRRRNPIRVRGIVDRTIQPAAIAATGALGLDVAWGYVPLPAEWKMGPMRHLAKGVGAIGLGWAAEQSKLVKKSTAHQMATGALTVVLHDMGRELMGQFLPQVALGEYLSYQPMTRGGSLGYYSPGAAVDGMGVYMSRPAPAPVAADQNGNAVEGYDPYSM